MGIKPLTLQQETFILCQARGMSKAASERASGWGTNGSAGFLKKRAKDIRKVMDFFRQQLFDMHGIDLNTLNQMALEAHRKSVSATEELKGVEVLAKLNQVGGFASTQVLKDRSDASKVEEKEIGPKSAKELERMSEADLLQIASVSGMESLDPQPIQRAEPVTVDDVPREADGDNPFVLEGELVD